MLSKLVFKGSFILLSSSCFGVNSRHERICNYQSMVSEESRELNTIRGKLYSEFSLESKSLFSWS